MEQDLSGKSGRGSQTGEVTEQAKQQTQQLSRQARQQAGQLATQGGERVKTQLSNQKHQASERLVPVQTALREVAEQLRKQDQQPVARYADRAADQVERASGYLRDTDVDEITNEVRGFARRRPSLFLGGALVLGFLGTRFLKSSSQEGGASAGDGSGATSIAAPDSAPVAALPAGSADTDVPTTRRRSKAGQPSGGRRGQQVSDAE